MVVALALRSTAILGKPGRYMSMAKGATADKEASTRIARTDKVCIIESTETAGSRGRAREGCRKSMAGIERYSIPQFGTMYRTILKPTEKGPTVSDPKNSGIQVIARAAAILRLLGKHASGLSLGALAQETGLARSTVQRIVQALHVEGFVESAGPQGGVRLGPLLGQLVYRQQIDIVDVARPFLEHLCAELNETVALSR